MNISPCPSEEQLGAFITGDLPDGDYDAICEHIELCPAKCPETVKRLYEEQRARSDGSPCGGTAAPPIVPGFELLGEIGRGGMGVVYKARQLSLERLVALKTILGAEAPARVRFLTEAEVLAAVRHPHVVEVFDYGTSDSRPWIAMELCTGGTLSDRLPQLASTGDKRVLADSRTMAELLRKIATGVGAAHDRGIVHRDLKPGNVLFDEAGEPKVTDFGLAKRSSSFEMTLSDAVLGTPHYMAPEQAVGRSKLATPSTDVWALGVILYRCLTGCMPFDGASLGDTLRLIQGVEPRAARALNPAVPRDLDTICIHCLQKDPSRRYTSASALADDLGRYLDGKPIQARPVGSAERVVKWFRRNPVIFFASLVVLIVASGGAGVALNQWWKREEESTNRKRAEEAEAKTRDLNAQLVTDRGVLALSRSDPTAAVFHLTSALAHSPPDQPVREQYLRTALASAYDSLHRLENVLTSKQEIRAAAANQAGTRFAFVDAGGALQFHELASGQTRQVDIRPAVLPQDPTKLSLAAVAFTPDGASLVTAADGGQVYSVDCQTLAYRQLCLFQGNPRAVGVSKDGTLAVGGIANDQASIATFSLADGSPKAVPLAVAGQVDAVAFSPDGRYLATSGRWENSLTVWDLRNRALAFPPIPHPGRVFSITFSADESRVVTGCIDGQIRFWQTASGALDGTPLHHSHPVRALAFLSTGEVDLLASGAEDGTVRVWDIGLRAPVGQPLKHLGNTRGVAFCAGTTPRLITAGFDQAVRVWQVRPTSTVATLRHPAGVTSILETPDGRSLFTGCRDAVGLDPVTGRPRTVRGAVRKWEKDDSGRWVVRQTLDQQGEALAVGLGGGLTLGAGNDGFARLWNAAGRPDRDPLPHDAKARNVVYTAAITNDGRYVAFAGQGKMIRLFDRSTGAAREWKGPSTGWVWTVAFSPDGTRLLTDGRSGVQVWSVPPPPGEVAPQWIGQLTGNDEVRWSTYSPDGTRILGCGFNKGQVSVWDGNGTLRNTFSGHQGQVYMGAFDPTDLDTIATVGADHTARVWNVRTGEMKADPIAHDAKVLCVAFSPDGRSMVTGCEDGAARIWAVEKGAWAGPILHHQGAVTRVTYLDGGRILTASNDGTARVWTLPQPIEGSPEQLLKRFRRETGMEPVRRDQVKATDPIRSDEGLLRVLTPEEWRSLRNE